jgi:hypothetical protein
MPVCLITNLPDGDTAIRYYDDGFRPEKRNGGPEVKRFRVYRENGHLVFCSGRMAASRNGTHGFTPEAVAHYKDEAAQIDEDSFLCENLNW